MSDSQASTVYQFQVIAILQVLLMPPISVPLDADEVVAIDITEVADGICMVEVGIDIDDMSMINQPP